MPETAVLDKPAAARPVRAPLALQHEVEQFLYHEAALVDEGRFRSWLELLADDIQYVMKTNTLALTRDRRKGIAPPSTFIYNEDKFQLERRVARLETGNAWAEEPASRTRHIVTNVRILAWDDADEIEVACNYLLHRAAKPQDHYDFVGTRRDRLRRVPGGEGWQIFDRQIELDQFVLLAPSISIFF
ncbi:3-phenylpropionate/cinnamic acid dioxygenase subunit beta [Azospirillum sp. TSO35-2]|uniref:3-phenylpropionate/cinnamic acid dioxygenase subunit beta n=1 Tax=Azospirillum sp. TSO35-2 TaxID=716796 RepID=UPI000D60C0F6|nr:3-phenylpropionate/cinnamic acid dioxygenase subunit beta [Azospirillum sp. TSO35-2]PWC37662.1 3-phenylpropionate dioxygenase [Azospirillum sp. TSO35-2]